MGVDHNRVALLAAVLGKNQGVDLIGCDLFVNVAGGIELSEPSADSAIMAALASCVPDAPVDPQTLVFGEVGLAGEARVVAQVEPRRSCKDGIQTGFFACRKRTPCWESTANA